MRERVTVSLPPDVVQEIDRRERNRSRFVLRAVRTELERLRREELHRSLANPHEESSEFADTGLDEWVQGGAHDEDLVDTEGGTAVSWEPGSGWRSER